MWVYFWWRGVRGESCHKTALSETNGRRGGRTCLNISPRIAASSGGAKKCHYRPLSAIKCHFRPLSAIKCHFRPKCGICSLPMWYICAVICQRRSPFGSRSMFDRFPLVLRYSFVRPSFVLRSVSVREARCNGDVTDKEKIRNKPECKSQRSLISCVTKWRLLHSKCRKNRK